MNEYLYEITTDAVNKGLLSEEEQIDIIHKNNLHKEIEEPNEF